MKKLAIAVFPLLLNEQRIGGFGGVSRLQRPFVRREALGGERSQSTGGRNGMRVRREREEGGTKKVGFIALLLRHPVVKWKEKGGGNIFKMGFRHIFSSSKMFVRFFTFSFACTL